MVPIGGDEGRRVPKAETFGPKEFTVARSAVDFLVGPVAGQHRVQWSMALGTVEALLVPHGALGELLLGGKHHAPATGTPLAGRGLDGRRVGIIEWSTGRNFVLPVEKKSNVP